MKANAPVAWIPRDVLSFLTGEAQSKAPCETGGVLLGYWYPNGGSVVVTRAVGPGPAAVHETGRFVPDHEYHVREVRRLYRESGRRLRYLGDWHTHPGAAAYLSPKDRRTLRRIASDRQARAREPLMVILAPGPGWEPHVWCSTIKGRLLCRKLRTRRLRVQIFGTR